MFPSTPSTSPPEPPTPTRLFVPETTPPMSPGEPARRFPATIVLASEIVPYAEKPAATWLELPLRVQFVKLAVLPEPTNRPLPLEVAELPLTVQLVSVAVLKNARTPP